MAGVALVCGFFMFCPRPVVPVQTAVSALAVTPTNEIKVVVPNASSFSYKETGLYLTRPLNVDPDNVYYGTISASDIIDDKINFYPESVTAIMRQDDQWIDLAENDANFWVKTEDDTSNFSVTWYLHETAPAAVYGVRCVYYEEYLNVKELTEATFQILYTQDWTYIKVTDSKTGKRRITNFAGGENMTLQLDVTFNEGAANPNLPNDGKDLTDRPGTTAGRVNEKDIVSTETMDIIVKSVSGQEVYNIGKQFKAEVNQVVPNRVTLKFNNKLGNDIYIVQFTSNADNRIIGQFIIDNSHMKDNVFLSQLWVILMIFGGLLALGAALAYLVPLMIVRVNEARVYKENERVARMKNPEAYADKKKKSFKEKVDKIMYNIKTPAYKRKKEAEAEEKEPTEQKVYTNRFTEMLRERQEKRDFMREHNVTSAEMEKMKEAEAVAAADEVNSFAFLRDDDDDEIATFHAAEDEISTLETGSYVQDGTTFAKLDSMRDENGNNGNENNDDGNN